MSTYGTQWSGNMSFPVKFFKVDVLPTPLVANAFYYVENGQYAEAYLTDTNGVAKKVGNSQMIEALTLDINAGFFS
jgi:hypothetical protein